MNWDKLIIKNLLQLKGPRTDWEKCIFQSSVYIKLINLFSFNLIFINFIYVVKYIINFIIFTN